MGVIKMIHAFRFHHAFKVMVNIKFYRCSLGEALCYQAFFGKEFAIGAKIRPVQGNRTDAFIVEIRT
ncbi:hypothetical protein D3C75_1011480 [compost metagenome]